MKTRSTRLLENITKIENRSIKYSNMFHKKYWRTVSILFSTLYVFRKSKYVVNKRT